MTSGLTTVTATSALSRETPTKETPETAETHIEKRLKRLWMRTGETMKRLRSTIAGRWWKVWVSGGRKWVLGSSKAVNVACLAVVDPSTNSALSQLLGENKKQRLDFIVFGPARSRYCCPEFKKKRQKRGARKPQPSICMLQLTKRPGFPGISTGLFLTQGSSTYTNIIYIYCGLYLGTLALQRDY
jgi:hypothetical protein